MSEGDLRWPAPLASSQEWNTRAVTEDLAGRSYAPIYRVAGRTDLHNFLAQALTPSGGQILWSSKATRAPIYFGVQSDADERLGLLCYPFRCSPERIKGRAVRRYADRPSEQADLDRILEAARRTPSSVNQQAWDFVVVTDRDRLQELSKIWRYAEHVGTSAATIALVTPVSDDRDERDTFQYDMGQATMSIMLAAADLGIASGHASVGDQALARRILGLPEDREVAILVALGFPADRPLKPISRPKRRPFDDVVHRERW